ncbi:MAG: efflux transporter outer membrane subunit [Verrucomicrobiota bacterium]|jgi:multidrug efflux system outer membrane protein
MKTPPFLSAGLLLLVAASCTVGPTYQPPVPAQIAPADWHWKLAEPGDALPKGDWWNVFHDPVLAGLESNALAANQNLRAAVARVDQARAAARLARSQFFPELSLDPSLSRQRVSGNEPLPFPVKLKPVYLDAYNVPLDLSYEIDLWGRVRRSFQSAAAQAQAAVADSRNILLTLAADIAVNYFLLRSLDAQIAAQDGGLQLREDSVRILQGRYDAGTIPELDAAQAKAELAAARSDLADLRRQRAETLDALALLCGQPASSFTLTASPLAASPPLVPVGIPSSVLERRPDIAAAERNLAAKSAQIGVARAAWFPVVRLTGQAGYLSGQANNLFNLDSLAFSFGPGASLPLFTAGRTAAQVRQAQSAYQESLASYQQAALTAFKEVEDSLAQITFWTAQAAAQADALASARRVTQLTQARYDAGLLAEFEVVTARRAELQQERQTAELTGRRYAATIRLIKALGGGWQD